MRAIRGDLEEAIVRPAVAMLAILTAGALSLALADPPAAVPATPAVTSAKTPAVAPVQPTPSASGEQVQEQLLRNQGYRRYMVQGEEKFCKREIPVGSHLATVMHCVTIAEAEAMAREGRETAERIQRNASGCLAHALGGCGN